MQSTRPTLQRQLSFCLSPISTAGEMQHQRGLTYWRRIGVHPYLLRWSPTEVLHTNAVDELYEIKAFYDAKADEMTLSVKDKKYIQLMWDVLHYKMSGNFSKFNPTSTPVFESTTL